MMGDSLQSSTTTAASSTATSAAAAPRKIKRLKECVVNRIAAGEIIHRPFNALKEMIENSLDAKSTSINITVKDGGLKLLQIQDNGTGICKGDLNLVCERFATSKLTVYEDLEEIVTHGFRGEALASISHAGHVTITTKTRDSPVAWRLAYLDGRPVSLNSNKQAGANVEPKLVAGNDGTTITVEDLFYNMPTRKKALKNTSEEYARILDIVQRYAIQNTGVAFSVKKHGSSNTDVCTQSTFKTIDCIRAIFGSSLAKELLPYNHQDATWEFKATGLISNANFNAKKLSLLLFINNRSVECSPLKRAIETVYATYLPKGSHPFIYLSLDIKSQNVDVNVHPTKKEVRFLNEDQIVDSIADSFQKCLAGANKSRVFKVQTLLPGVQVIGVMDRDPPKPIGGSSSGGGGGSSGSKNKVPEHKLVRTDSRATTLDSFLVRDVRPLIDETATATISTISKVVSGKNGDDEDDKDVVMISSGKVDVITIPDGDDDFMILENDERSSANKEGVETGAVTSGNKKPRIDYISADSQEETPSAVATATTSTTTTSKRQYTEIRLTSVISLRKEVVDACHHGLTDIIQRHTFVGCVDHTKALIQHQTKLFLVDYQELSFDFFYQMALKGFGNFGHLSLENPVSISELVGNAIEAQDDSLWDKSKMTNNSGQGDILSREEITKLVTTTIVSRRAMLLEYFSMEVDENGLLYKLPLLLKDYIPDLSAKLPLFLLRLGSEVDWQSEKGCFQTFCHEIALLYVIEPPSVENPTSSSTSSHPPLSNSATSEAEDVANITAFEEAPEVATHRSLVSNVLFPAFKKFGFIATKDMVDAGLAVQLADLPELYKIFERC